ncbi:MAG: FtsX extracellular domain, partial [Cryptosporangiaceae bacterium]|nr:FtsX extracellular domain [Cryptosporangiaceae bacterium]
MPTTVFLADTITAAERQAVKARILTIPGARDVKYESREQAWRRFHELFKQDP